MSLNTITPKLHLKKNVHTVCGSACFSTYSSEMEYMVCFLIYRCNDTLHQCPNDDGIAVKIPPTERLVQLLTLVLKNNFTFKGGQCGRERMVVGIPTTCAISAYYHYCCEFESRSGEVYSIQQYVIKFVSDLRQVDGFRRVPPVSSTNKTDRHDIGEILFKVALNTINQTTFKRDNY